MQLQPVDPDSIENISMLHSEPTQDASEVEAVDAAWSAGFIDGEGSIMLDYMRPKEYHRRGRVEKKYGQVIVHLRVSQTMIEPMQKLQNLFNGQLKALDMSLPSRVKNRRQIWEWNVFGSKAVAVIKCVRPYLMVKHEQADLAIAFHDECFRVEGIMETRIAYYELMQELQRKGIHLRRDIDYTDL